jgi:hypothetical protein
MRKYRDGEKKVNFFDRFTRFHPPEYEKLIFGTPVSMYVWLHVRLGSP